MVNFFDPALGYTEYYLAKKQAEHGFNVCVLTSDYSINSKKKFSVGTSKVDGVYVVRIKAACRFRGNVLFFNPLTLSKFIKFFSPNVIHCHGLFSPLAQEVLLLKSFYGYKLVGDLITGISPLTFQLIQVFKKFFDHWFSNRVNEFFACNKAIESFLLETLRTPPSKTHFIPLGADQELFKPDRTKRKRTRILLGIHPEDVVAIYTGKFLPSKRIHDLLIASKAIIEQHKNFKVVLVGDGPPSYREILGFLSKELGIKNNVLTIKTVHRTELPDFYNAADFAIWPGSFSISVIEAMACGLPVIIAKSNWTTHHLEYKNGFSFKAGDTKTLSSLSLRLSQSPKLRMQMGEMSRKLVEEKLNWNTIANQYLDVYK